MWRNVFAIMKFVLKKIEFKIGNHKKSMPKDDSKCKLSAYKSSVVS